VAGRGFCHTPLVAVGTRVNPRSALELGMLGEPVDAEAAARLGLANRVLDASTWRSEVDRLAHTLALGFNRNAADGKRIFYEQSAAATLRERYEIATPAMVDMFASPNFRRHARRFVKKKK